MRHSIFSKSLILFVYIFFYVAESPETYATIFTLRDKNSTAKVNTENAAGMFSWEVDGTERLAHQWFWYRVGTGTGEHSIDTLTLSSQGTFDTNFDNFDDTLFVRYTGTGFDLELKYVLNGSAADSGNSSITENITITNRWCSALDFHFFQYSDFNLSGSSDWGEMVNSNTIKQWDSSFVVSETVVTPEPDHWQIGEAGTIYDDGVGTGLLDDSLASTLSDAASPYNGDVTWAFQWDLTIDAENSCQITKSKQIRITPEPATVIMVGWGLLGIFISRKKI